MDRFRRPTLQIAALATATLGANAIAAPIAPPAAPPILHAIAPIPIIPAQSNGDRPPQRSESEDPTPVAPWDPFATTQLAPGTATPHATQFILRRQRENDRICDRVDLPYRIDCIRYGLRSTAELLPTEGDYGEVRKVLTSAADKLDQVVARNRDPTAAPVVARGAGRRSPGLSAIRPEAETRALREAEAILAEAETLLLRSSENSARRQVHFQQIAQAIDSTKVLLRST